MQCGAKRGSNAQEGPPTILTMQVSGRRVGNWRETFYLTLAHGSVRGFSFFPVVASRSLEISFLIYFCHDFFYLMTFSLNAIPADQKLCFAGMVFKHFDVKNIFGLQ